VEPGRLLAGEYPGDPDEAEARRRLRALLEAGITDFVNLTHAYEPGSLAPLQPYEHLLRQEAAARGMTVSHHRLPIPDFGLPQTPEHMARILNTLDAALEASRKVYVHCWGGIGRTGMVVGCYLVRRGRTGEQALRELAEVWRTVPKSVWYPRSPQTDEQIAYVRAWAEPDRRGA
jgi:hypothetical protein